MNRTRFCLSKFYSFPCDSLCWEREQHRSVRTFFLSSRSITRQTGEFLIEFLHLIKLREKREAGILLANDSFSYISGGSLRWSIFFLDFLPDSLRSPFLPCAAAAATSSVALNHNRKYPSLVTGFAWVVFVEENRRRHRCAATEREWEKERGGGGTRSAARFYQFDESIYIYIYILQLRVVLHRSRKSAEATIWVNREERSFIVVLRGFVNLILLFFKSPLRNFR